MIVCEGGETDNWNEYVSKIMALAAILGDVLPSSNHSLVFAFTKTGCTSDPLNVAKKLGITVDMTAKLDTTTRAT
jgi:hypothetical protein